MDDVQNIETIDSDRTVKNTVVHSEFIEITF